VFRRLMVKIMVWRLRHNRRVMAGLEKSLQEYKEGKFKPWSEVKKELNIE
jgi:hypothetical protein